MRHQSKSIFFLLGILIVALLFSSSKSVTAQEVDDEREFDYLEGSKKGPRHWGDLKQEWAICKNGTMQSPIDLLNQRVQTIPRSEELKMSYKPCNATVKNRGHDISLQWWNSSAGTIQINCTDYFLQQAHWHSPSEHTINGRRYGMELHMVHVSRDPNVKNNIAVIGQLYQIGAPDILLSKLIDNVISMADEVKEKIMGMMDPNEIKMTGKKYYRYMGSLTVPPCTEGVIWTINKEIMTVSREQIGALRAAVHDYAQKNERPLQPLNQRVIQVDDLNEADKLN